MTTVGHKKIAKYYSEWSRSSTILTCIFMVLKRKNFCEKDFNAVTPLFEISLNGQTTSFSKQQLEHFTLSRGTWKILKSGNKICLKSQTWVETTLMPDVSKTSAWLASKGNFTNVFCFSLTFSERHHRTVPAMTKRKTMTTIETVNAATKLVFFLQTTRTNTTTGHKWCG